jgi:chromosome segregation ATPase
MPKNHVKLIAVFFSMIAISLGSFVFAKEDPNVRATTPVREKVLNSGDEKRIQIREEVKTRAVEVRCTTRETRIQNKIDMYNRSEKFHEAKFQRVYDRLMALVAKLDEKNVDTSTLKTNLATLKEKIEVLQSKHAALIQALENLKGLECTETEKLNNSLPEIKSLVEEVRKAAQDIQSFLGTTVKSTLSDLKTELQSLKTEDKPKVENQRNTANPAIINSVDN